MTIRVLTRWYIDILIVISDLVGDVSYAIAQYPVFLGNPKQLTPVTPVSGDIIGLVSDV